MVEKLQEEFIRLFEWTTLISDANKKEKHLRKLFYL
jgi:hypothetical protein